MKHNSLREMYGDLLSQITPKLNDVQEDIDGLGYNALSLSVAITQLKNEYSILTCLYNSKVSQSMIWQEQEHVAEQFARLNQEMDELNNQLQTLQYQVHKSRMDIICGINKIDD